MEDGVKKISFGFSKQAKKTSIVSSRLSNIKQEDVSKVEFIDCLEGKSIKLKDPVKSEQKTLVIPLSRLKEESSLDKDKQLELVDSSPVTIECEGQNVNKTSENLIKGEVPFEMIDEHKQNEKQTKCETLDEIAAREILEELNRKNTEDNAKRVFEVPLTTNAPLGEKESSLEDYENIPVGDFGLAMLRGMGWAPGKGIGKNEKLVTPTLPTPRPKGMGLGADKVIKTIDSSNTNEDLKMVKGSFVRVVAGSEKDAYGQIEGFDDESGRLIVKLVLKNTSVSLSEFMVQLVDKHEFNKNSKVINVSKYEQYKEGEIRKEPSRGKSCDMPVANDKLNKKVGISSIKPDHNESNDFRHSHSSSSESERKRHKKSKIKATFDSNKSRDSSNKKRSDRSSRSPSVGYRQNDYSRSQSRNHQSQSTKYEKDKSHRKSSKESYRPRSHSTDSSGSSRTSSKNRTSKSKISIKRSVTRRKTSSDSSVSSDSSKDYTRKKQHKQKKNKSSSKKYRSRSRSQSPRKHKHKKSRR